MNCSFKFFFVHIVFTGYIWQWQINWHRSTGKVTLLANADPPDYKSLLWVYHCEWGYYERLIFYVLTTITDFQPKKFWIAALRIWITVFIVLQRIWFCIIFPEKNIKIVDYWCNVTMRLYWRFESLHLIIEANLYSSLCWEVPIKRFGMGKNKNKFHERLVWIRDLTDLPACAYCNVFFPVRSNKIANIFWHLLGRNSYAHF